MGAVLIWLATVGVGLLLIAITAALKKLAFHAFVCALISINFVILALREHERRLSAPAQQLELMSINARFIGCNWLWMSLAIIVMHLRNMALNGAMSFAVAGIAAAVLSLGFGRLIVHAHALRPDRISRYLRIAALMAFVQLASAFVTLAVLITNSLGEDARYDWPSVSVITFSTVALAIISARALLTLATPLTAKLAAGTVTTGVPWRSTAQG